MTTVGLGDYVPQTDAGQTFLMVYACGGLGLLAMALTTVSDALQAPVFRSEASLRAQFIAELHVNEAEGRNARARESLYNSAG